MAGALNLPADGLTRGSTQQVVASCNVGIGTRNPRVWDRSYGALCECTSGAEVLSSGRLG
jgi:hypothetical protein